MELTNKEELASQLKGQIAEKKEELFNKLQSEVNQKKAGGIIPGSFEDLQSKVNEAKSTRDLAGDTEFTANNKTTIEVDDLDSPDSIEDLTTRIGRLSGETSRLSEASQEELELSNRIKKDDLTTQQERKNLYGQGTGVPISLLQGKERRVAENRTFDRAFDMLELDLLESSRIREQKVAAGELSQAVAESEAIAEATKSNTDLLDRLIKINSGATIEEIAQESPETFARIQSALANSNYSMGDIRQGLQNQIDKGQKNLQFKNINGQLVGVDPLTGKVVTTLGKAGNPSTSSSGGSSTGSGSGSKELTTVLNLVPDMSNENAQAVGRMLSEKGAEERTVIKIAQEFPKAFKNNRVSPENFDELSSEMKSLLSPLSDAVKKAAAPGLFSRLGDKKKEKSIEDFQAELSFWQEVVSTGVVEYDDGAAVKFLTRPEKEKLFQEIQEVIK